MGEYDCLYLHACNFKNRPFKCCVGNCVFCCCRRRPMLLLCIQCFLIYDLLRFIYIFVFVLPITLDLFFPPPPTILLFSNRCRMLVCCQMFCGVFVVVVSADDFCIPFHCLFIAAIADEIFRCHLCQGWSSIPAATFLFYKVDHVAISSQTQRKNKIKKETTNTKYNQINYKDNVKLCTLEK